MTPQDIMWWSTFNAALTGLLAANDKRLLLHSTSMAFTEATAAHGMTPDSYNGPRGIKS